MFGKLMPYVAAGLAVFAVIAGFALAVQNARLDTAKANLRAAQFGVDACAEANAAQGSTIEELQAAQLTNRMELAAAQITVSTLTVSMGEWRERAMVAESSEERLRRAIYANDPECAKWGDALVCPGIAVRLRQAAGQGRDPN